MPPDASTSARFAILREEVDSIHFANNLNWKQGERHSVKRWPSMNADRNRLEEIRRELETLKSVD